MERMSAPRSNTRGTHATLVDIAITAGQRTVTMVESCTGWLASVSAGRPAEQVAENLVEAAHAAEARGQSHFGHRQARVVQQLLGEQHAARLCGGDRRGAEMGLEQPPPTPA